MIAIKYCGTFNDYSGYGSANRAFITSLRFAEIDITTELVVQVPEAANHGWTGELCNSLIDRNIDYKIKIIHLTPDMYPRYMEKGKYHIGHLFWETDRLPKTWIEPINQMGEIWTSSESMATLFKNDGVKVPIYYFPQPIDVTEADKKFKKYSLPNHNGFIFYSMFQWIERKNPRGLITTFWNTFSGRNDVSLLLKTYRVNYTKDEFDKIQIEIQHWKRENPLPHYPRVYIVNRLLTHKEIMRVHATGDCYVSADHGEGWNRCLHEALLMAKPAISTARGGIHEHLNPDVYFPIPSKYVPVVKVPWIPYYEADQQWAEPDYKKLEEAMEHAFNNRTGTSMRGLLAQKYIKENFNYFKVGSMMKKRLEEINKGL